MNHALENRFAVERQTEESRWTMTTKLTLDEAKAWIGSAEHWRITDYLANKVVGKSEGDLPEIFDRDLNAAAKAGLGTSHVKTETQTGYISRFKSPRGI